MTIATIVSEIVENDEKMDRKSRDKRHRSRERTTIPLLMVSATLAPTKSAPRNSQIAAARTACFILKDREDTDVAKELATSLAPMLKASSAAKMVCD